MANSAVNPLFYILPLNMQLLLIQYAVKRLLLIHINLFCQRSEQLPFSLMKLFPLSPQKALRSRAYYKQSVTREQIDRLQQGLSRLFSEINEGQNEEYHKNLITSLLQDIWYKDAYHVNVNQRQDLVVRLGRTVAEPVGVILEFKKPVNKAEMISAGKANVKALQELLLYYLRERLDNQNTRLTHLVATNLYEWFIFDEKYFETHFVRNVQLKKEYEAWKHSGKDTRFFYENIAAKYIDAITDEVPCVYLDLRKMQQAPGGGEKTDRQWVDLYKILSPTFLLKLPTTNDSNALNKEFYGELLHILGLEEYKDGGKKLIRRKPEGKRDEGSLLENAIGILKNRNKLHNVHSLSSYGETEEEQLFGVGLELCITWLNRILFLKLLEAQLIRYHNIDRSYAFLHLDRVRDFDELNELFFDVLAVETRHRSPSVQQKYGFIPYLNSSLFEATQLEDSTFEISSLKDRYLLPLYPHSVLKDGTGKKRLTGQKATLQYLFEFLNAYDFASESTADVRETNKALINASVLGLIFEKINGYKDGSFYTPGFITMYMCRETLRRAVVDKFNARYNWNCESFEALQEQVEYKDKAKREEANGVINSLRVCDPAVGSGHFLVSALNELLSIKSDLKILSHQDGSRERDYVLKVENDELTVYEEETGQVFEYQAPATEGALASPRQRLQETLFQEKQTLIENCLFGVDINPNSVKICRLRLWIELLKNAYYRLDKGATPSTVANPAKLLAVETLHLETLPNLDINIKCGNSIVSRFPLDTDLKKALKSIKYNVEQYKGFVRDYKNARDKEQKRGLERIIDSIKASFRTEIAKYSDPRVVKVQKLGYELFLLTNQGLFDQDAAQDETYQAQKSEKVRKLEAEINTLSAELEEAKNNALYRNAFEWRFEFPEVLDDEGRYQGFECDHWQSPVHSAGGTLPLEAVFAEGVPGIRRHGRPVCILR